MAVKKLPKPKKLFCISENEITCEDVEQQAAIWIAQKDNPIQQSAGHYLRFMKSLGIELNTETMDTPLRVARMFWNEFCSFHDNPPGVARFRNKNYDEYVIEKDIDFSSLCEHHHLPFIGRMVIAYHPNEWLAGLSKLPRTVRHFASRPQLQEHLMSEIGEYLNRELAPHGMMLIAQATHACMQCRGVRSNASTITSKIIGDIDKNEVLNLLKI